MTLGSHCTVRRDNGRLVIEIPEDQILRHLSRTPGAPAIFDREAFLSGLSAAIPEVEVRWPDDVYQTALQELVEAAAHAVRDGTA